MVISYYGSAEDTEFWAIINFLNCNYISLPKSIDKIPTKLNYDLISKLTLSEYTLSSQQIRSKVAKERKNYELIVIEPKSAGIAAFAARDNRVDLVRINPKTGLSVFNKRYGNRLIEFDTIVEIDLTFFFQRYIASTLRPIKRILETFETLNLKYHLTNSPTAPAHLRSYRGLQSLGRIIGLSNKSTSPEHVLTRVRRNRKKLNGEIPFPGVELHGSKD